MNNLELSKRLFDICTSELPELLEFITENKSLGIGFNNRFLVERQLKAIETELINKYAFDRIVWMDLPAQMSEDGKVPVVVSSRAVSDMEELNCHGKVGYIYELGFDVPDNQNLERCILIENKAISESPVYVECKIRYKAI